MPNTDKGVFSELGFCIPVLGYSRCSLPLLPHGSARVHTSLSAPPPEGPTQAVLRRCPYADLAPVIVISAAGSCSGR